MAGTQSVSNRITIITDANAKPINEREKEVTSQLVVTALRGSWGVGNWDGGSASGWVPGTGSWEKHAESWDASVQTDLNGPATVTFPFSVIRNIAKVYKVQTDGTTEFSANYIENGKSLAIDHVGRVVVELTSIKNTREVTV